MEHTLRKVVVIVLAIVAALAFFAGAEIIQMEGNNIQSNSGLNGNITLGSQVSYIEAWDGSSWHLVTITSHTGNQVVFTIPKNTTLAYVFTANKAADVSNLLDNGTTFITADVTAGSNTTLTGAYAYLATIHNSSSSNAVGDHGFASVVTGQLLYNNNTNNLGTPLQFNILDMLSGNQKATLQYQLNFKNTTSSVQVTVTGTQQYAVHLNIKQSLEYVAMVLYVFDFVLALFAFPRVKGMGRMEIKRNEAIGIVAAIVGFGITYAIVNYVGGLNSFIGIGLPYEVAFGFGLGAYFYGTLEEEGRFDAAIFWGIIGTIAIVVVSAFFPFLTPIANLANYEIGGAVTAILAVLTDLVLIAGGIAATKHSRFEG